MYATIDDFKIRLGVLFDRIYANAAAAGDDLADAAAEIDGCLAKRYAVPVAASSAAMLLKSWNLTLAEERAYARGSAGKLAEEMQKRIDQVRKYLQMILDAKFQLVGADENAAGGSMSLVQIDEPVFTRKKMAGY